jgi:hypothetical protein
MMNTAACRAVENIPALDRRDAFALADEIIDDVIAALQRDRNIPSRSFTEWEMRLANLRARIAERIDREITGHVSLSAVLLEIEAAIDWQELFDA